MVLHSNTRVVGNPWLRHSSHPERSVKPYCLLGCFFWSPLPCLVWVCVFFSFCCQRQEEEVTQGQEEEVTQGTFFPFAARERRRKLQRERAVLFFLLLPRRGGGGYTGNGQCCFSFCCQGQEEEVTQGTGSVVFPFAARTGGGNYTGNGQLPGTAHTDRHQTDRHVALICRIHCKSPNGCK